MGGIHEANFNNHIHRGPFSAADVAAELGRLAYADGDWISGIGYVDPAAITPLQEKLTRQALRKGTYDDVLRNLVDASG